MTRPRSRLRKAARIAGYAGAILVVLAIVVAIGAPIYYSGERFGRLVEAAMPEMRGKIRVGRGRWSWGMAWALARARPATGQPFPSRARCRPGIQAVHLGSRRPAAPPSAEA